MSEQIKILLIEDNPGDAKLVEIYLKSVNDIEFEIEHKVRLAEGIAYITENTVDVVLLDLSLPDSSGLDSLDNLLKAAPDASVVLLTGFDNEEFGINAVKKGAQDYLVKGSIEAPQLVKTILYAKERNHLQKQVKKFSENLEISKQKLQEAQMIAKLGSYEMTLDGKETFWSDQMFQLFEFEKSEIIPDLDSYYSKIFPVDLEEVKSKINHAVENQAEFAIEHRLNLANNEVKYVRNQGRVKTNIHRKGLKLIGTVQDITDYKKAEEALLESEERYRTIFEESQDAIYITTIDGKFVEFNNSLLKLLRYEKDEFELLDATKIYADEEARIIFKEEIEKKGSVVNYDIKLKRSNGTAIDCMVTSTLWRGIDGTIIGYHGIIRDITERKQRDELIREKEVAEKSARLKQQFLANMSHEIRTPMNVVVGMTHLLKDTNLTDKQIEYVNALKLSSENLLRIINDILDFSKIEAGKLDLEERPFKVKELIEELIKSLNYKAKEQKTSLFQMIDINVPDVVVGDELRLNQVLINLVSNAIKYTENGEVILKLELISETDKTIDVKFSVKDSGIGITEEKQATIFESFTQASMDTTRLYGGTGLGLSIAKQMVELMGGSISVESEPGKGSTFIFNSIFRKSIEEKDKDAAPIMDEEVEYQPTFDITRQIKILLVEDHKMNQIVASDLLNKAFPNLVLDIAENGQIGVDKALENKYDIVLMDISMPVMNGLDATRKIRAEISEEKKHLPIIAMTAHAFSKEVDNCYEAGMNDFISKPINPNILKNKTVKFLNSVFSDESEEIPNDLEINYSNKDEEESNGQVSEAVLRQIDTSELTAVLNEPSPADIKSEIKEKVINLEYLRQIADNDAATLRVMIETLLNDTPGELVNLRKAYEERSWDDLKSVAHKMKSTIAYLGIKQVQDTIKSLEHDGFNRSNEDTMDERISEVDRYCRKAFIDLKEELENL